MDNKKPAIKYVALRLIFAIAAGFAIFNFKIDYLEGYLFDLRAIVNAYTNQIEPADSPIVLVQITPKTIERFQGDPKFKDHIKFLNLVTSQNPKFIIYEFRISDDDRFADITGTPQEEKEFSNFVKSIPNLIFSTQNLKMKGDITDLSLRSPLDIKLSSMPISADNKSFSKDGVTRRLMYQYQDQTMTQALVAAHFNPSIQNPDNIRGSFYYLESYQVYINYKPKGFFKTYSFEDVIDQKIPKEALEGKVIIFGTDLERTSKDYVATPFSRQINAMTAAELQANQIQTLIDNNAPVKVPKYVDLILTILTSILTVYVTLSLTPAKGLMILAATLFGASLFALISFVFFGIWFDLAHPFLAIFLCYYFFIPYRLIRENRKSWEYYQKHKLLSEVEQLKTNFISMMSHDLKTPIARITGMTEVIYKDPVQLSPHQREALDTIRHSSDDLLKFINAILQYGSIESQGVQLHKQSKDINALVADVVKKHQFLANVKKIKIIQELEPMFPTSVDPELMKQVFSNLLENAIKYSPEESTVHIRTREENDSLIIEFQDQGMGIPQEDLPNIFMKFFRTHNAKTTTIKGSGLGLYLAQYFVELHKGKITVDSSQDKGSKFTVELPLDK
ncbi:ATP-binding protein [Pseudobdellovibrio sp. HCB154]|uniref:ATP-binding protein n=1 Tax=Pseudobdellovibrio sp. HCB154 TaxID=3386277 RepID=UPI003916DBD7